MYAVIPTYDEAENLPALLAELFTLPIEHFNVVVVDDASPDGTGEIAETLRLEYGPRLHVLHRPAKQGLGAAYRHGFGYALQLGAHAVVQMDADFSHSPQAIPQLLGHLGPYDVVVGSRYVPGGRLDQRWNRWRVGLSWWANRVYASRLLGLRTRDATAGFKAWTAQALEIVLAYPIASSGYIFQVEMATLAERLGFQILEIPITFEDRRIGRSKMDLAVKFEAAWRTWQLRWRYRRIRPIAGELRRPEGLRRIAPAMPLMRACDEQ